MSSVKLSIIIVSWNTKALLKACLESVYTYPPQCSFDVWVVDNASSDGSTEMVREQFPQVALVANEDNGGFAQGNNQAIRLCQSEYVLLLNPDTEVKPDAMQALVDFMDENHEVGAAGSMLLNPDGTLQHSCHPMPTLSRELWRLFHLDTLRPYGRYHMRKWDTAVPHRVDVIQGASLILRRSILDRIGLLDESYFMYSEEVDLCYRLQQTSWQLYWVPQSKVIHYGGQSTEQVAAKMFVELYRAKLHFFRKNYGKEGAFIYKLILLSASTIRLLLTPLALMTQPARQEKILNLAHHYRLLLSKLANL